jgi:hypothetical protein
MNYNILKGCLEINVGLLYDDIKMGTTESGFAFRLNFSKQNETMCYFGEANNLISNNKIICHKILGK